MTSFKPSEDFVKTLFRYHRARRNVIRKRLLGYMVVPIQERLGNTFNKALVTFGYKMLLKKSKQSVVLIDGHGKNFCDDFSGMLDKLLGLDNDAGRDGILYQLLKEFTQWLEKIGGICEAQSIASPYKQLYLFGDGGVIMKINKALIQGSGKSIGSRANRIRHAIKEAQKITVH